MKKWYSDEQIIGFLRKADAGVSVKDLCRRHGFSEASFYLWRGKYGVIIDRRRLPVRINVVLTILPSGLPERVRDFPIILTEVSI
jgi:Transposase